VRPRSKAVALSLSLVIAASGAASASATARESSQQGNALPALSQDSGPEPTADNSRDHAQRPR
jgi:hypothetical protein